MKNVYLNFKKYVEECVRSRARRRRLYALLTALSLIAAGGVVFAVCVLISGGVDLKAVKFRLSRHEKK